MKHIVSLAILSVLFLPGCVSSGKFKNMDDDSSGGISRQEASHSQALADLFNSADENNDGVLDEEEYALVYQVISKNRAPTQQRRKMMTEKGGR
ncbi:EF hand domain-containing protein [Panacagrimonas perspica]|uniref:EF hand domain-containing protein n=1 Tax=Panacagrimonas perspica TaxID=381431 RepID=A0A4S3KAY1_9GAMM|nr:hypothetical protein [Panacagrimonas perspica]TDU32632.1 EF hand domain-containing protein [Panacagrimonas perspica]THD05520.1 hypothetical protein B1810_02030 [Panacagrimonas perspica]